MLRRILSLMVLAAMILHCANRLGGISYLYEKRHDIAFTFGLITEKPIAVCSSRYHSDNRLTIAVPDSDKNFPQVVQSQENNLFCVALLIADHASPYSECKPLIPVASDQYDSNTLDSIFRPPLLTA